MKTGRKREKDVARTRRAAQHPDRPGEGRGAVPGEYRPAVSLSRCEGKGDCVAVCPYGVFELGPIEENAYRALPWIARLKLLAHGRKTALTPNIDACQACGLCVVACPERAITLVRTQVDVAP